MAVDPYIARGITPLGQGLPEALMQVEGMRIARERSALYDKNLQQDQARMQYGMEQNQQAQELERERQEGLMLLPLVEKGEPRAIQRALSQIARRSPEAAQIYSQNPQQLAQAMRQALGVKADESAGGNKIGNFNPGDYTPESFAAFMQTNDPRVLKRYVTPAQDKVVVIGGVPTMVNPRSGERNPLSTLPQEVDAAAALTGAKATADAAAKATADANATNVQNQRAWDTYQAGMAGLVAGLSGSETGPVSGRIPAWTAAQQSAEGSVAAMAPVLKQLFRSAGEGTFTDRDQQMLIEMLPTRKDRPEARDFKLGNIESIVRAKLGIREAVEAPTSSQSRRNPPKGKAASRAVSELSDDELKKALGL